MPVACACVSIFLTNHHENIIMLLHAKYIFIYIDDRAKINQRSKNNIRYHMLAFSLLGAGLFVCIFYVHCTRQYRSSSNINVVGRSLVTRETEIK